MSFRYTDEKIPDRPANRLQGSPADGSQDRLSDRVPGRFSRSGSSGRSASGMQNRALLQRESDTWKMISAEELFRGSGPAERPGMNRKETGMFAELLRMTWDYQVLDEGRVEAFLKQARRMESYEEDGPVPDTDYYHTYIGYQEMTSDELHHYFAWRTKLRRGEAVPYRTGFILLHAAELINLIGVGNMQEAFESLLRLMQTGQPAGSGLAGSERYLSRLHTGRDGAVSERSDAGLAGALSGRSGAGLAGALSGRSGAYPSGALPGRNGAYPSGRLHAIHAEDRRRFERILSDFVLVWGPPQEIVEAYCIPDMDRESQNITLLHVEESSDAAVYQMIAGLTDRRILNSAFLENASEDGWRVIARTFRRICQEQKRAGSPVLSDRLLGKRHIRPRQMFPYLPYRTLREDGYEVQVSPATSYQWKDGKWFWSAYSAMRSDDALRDLNALVRECDRVLRKKTHYRNQLPDRMKNPAVEKLIGEEYDRWLAEKERRNRPEIRVDLSKLGAIRDLAAITRDRLLEGTEEGMEAEALNRAEEGMKDAPSEKTSPEAAVTAPETGSPEEQFAGGSDPQSIFTVREEAFLRILLEGGNGADYFRDHKMIPSVFIDAINEKAYDEIGDSIVEEDGAGWHLIEDYLEEVEKLF